MKIVEFLYLHKNKLNSCVAFPYFVLNINLRQ